MIKTIKASKSEKILFIFLIVLAVSAFSSFFLLKSKCLFIDSNDLKTLNFNYRVLYNGGFDMKVFLKAKMNEFLIGSYVQFLDVLTYRKQPFIPITFNNNSYKQGLYLYNNNNNETTGLFLIKSGLINFETQTQNYMYIF